MKALPSILTLLALSSGASFAATFFGVTTSNELVSFNSANPASFLSSVSITGLVGADGVTPDGFGAITGLSYDIDSGFLHGVDGNANFYRIATNGVATLVGNTFSPVGADAGLSWDPFSGEHVWVDDAGSVFTLSNAGAATELGTAFFGVGDVNEGATPAFFGLGIDPLSPGITFALSGTGTLVHTVDPGLLEWFTVGELGTAFSTLGDLVVDLDGNLFAALSEDANISAFYSIDSATGAATLVGGFGTGLFAVAIPEPAVSVLGAFGTLLLFRRRR